MVKIEKIVLVCSNCDAQDDQAHDLDTISKLVKVNYYAKQISDEKVIRVLESFGGKVKDNEYIFPAICPDCKKKSLN